MKTINIVKFLIALGLPLAVGAIAGMFTAKAIPEWYASLNRPSISPPNWVFGPVWTILYILMGFSFYLIWIQPPDDFRTMAIVIYLLQLFLNFGWSFLFFYFKRPGFALAEIIILWIAILAMIFLFYKIRPIATYLNIPYFLWVSFATILNAAYYHLN
jgi:tryptophan-rich sensory protein